MSYVHQKGGGAQPGTLPPLASQGTRAARWVVRGIPLAQELEAEGGGAEAAPQKPCHHSSLRRKLLTGFLSRCQGCPVRLYMEGGFAKTQQVPLAPLQGCPTALRAVLGAARKGSAGAGYSSLTSPGPVPRVVSPFHAGPKAVDVTGHSGHPWRATGRSCSIQHGIQLVSQGIKHGADVIQNVLGGGHRRTFSLLSTDALLCSP